MDIYTILHFKNDLLRKKIQFIDCRNEPVLVLVGSINLINTIIVFYIWKQVIYKKASASQILRTIMHPQNLRILIFEYIYVFLMIVQILLFFWQDKLKLNSLWQIILSICLLENHICYFIAIRGILYKHLNRVSFTLQVLFIVVFIIIGLLGFLFYRNLVLSEQNQLYLSVFWTIISFGAFNSLYNFPFFHYSIQGLYALIPTIDFLGYTVKHLIRRQPNPHQIFGNKISETLEMTTLLFFSLNSLKILYQNYKQQQFQKALMKQNMKQISILKYKILQIQKKQNENIINQQSKTTRKNNQEQDWNCAICLFDKQSEDIKIYLKCNHKFHARCLLNWIIINLKCPFCRKKIDVM